MIDLTAAWPEVATLLPPRDVHLARHALVAPVVTAQDEDIFGVLGPRARGGFTVLVVEGVVLKTTALAGRSALELLGPGDFLALPLSAARQVESPAVSRYTAHGHASVAVLGGPLRTSAPALARALRLAHDRLGRQTHRASRQLAILHLPRVEERIVALFADFAERFGRVTPDRIVIELPLTHQLIGELVASRRPTSVSRSRRSPKAAYWTDATPTTGPSLRAPCRRDRRAGSSARQDGAAPESPPRIARRV